jgi:SAM-dependent methyltransferase
MTEAARWEDRYRTGDTPWDTGHPSTELQRVVASEKIAPGRAIDLGCGTGVNTIWLAEQGFDATGVDLSPLAVERARKRPAPAGRCHFLQADLLNPPAELRGPFGFLFDRGCYHVVRRLDVQAYLRTLKALTGPGTVGLVLAGNAREPLQPGPPVVTEEELRQELGSVFEIVWLREFRFDETAGEPFRPLGWSCLIRRPPG